VALFYAAGLIITIFSLLSIAEVKALFQKSRNSYWDLLPFVFIIPTVISIFIPNLPLFKWDQWLLMNAAICLVNPWLEELYWRGLVYKLFGNSTLLSFLFSSLAFGLSHPLIFGVNSKGVSGWAAFIGAAFVGAVWWVTLRKTGSLRGNVLTHFLMDLAGMAVYILANKALLLPLPG
jgi:uncharacterized protein